MQAPADRPVKPSERNVNALDAGAPDAIDMLCSVVGATRIQVSGFSADSARRPGWTHASPIFVRAPADPLDLVPTLKGAIRFNRGVVAFAAAGLCLCGVGLGQVLGTSRLNDLVGAQSVPSGWAVESVHADFVRLRAGAQTADVRVGESLPNGDVVVSVSPANRMVVLGSGTLVLHQHRPERAQESAP